MIPFQDIPALQLSKFFAKTYKKQHLVKA